MRLLRIYNRFFFRRILFLLYLSIFVFLYVVLDNKAFSLVTFSIQNPFFEFFNSFSTFFYAILIFIIFAATTTIVELILTVRNTRKQNKKAQRQKEIHNNINSKFFKHLQQNHQLDADIYYVQEHKLTYTEDYPRLVFINRLRRILILTTGEVHQRCIRIFQLLNEESLLKTYLKSPYLRHKLLAINTIGDFKLRFFNDEIKKLMQHKNEVIASEAMYAFTKISENTNFRFLVERNKPISRLDFYNFVQLGCDNTAIDYNMLITHPIPSISALGLRFAGIHKIKSVKGEIFKRINHSDSFVREEAQSSYLNMIEELDAIILLNRYDAFTKRNQFRILKLLGQYLNNSLVLSLFNEIINNYEYDIKLAALKVMIQHNITATLKFRNHPNAMVSKAFKQLTDF